MWLDNESIYVREMEWNEVSGGGFCIGDWIREAVGWMEVGGMKRSRCGYGWKIRKG